MLSEQLLELVPGAAEVRGVEQLTGGASRETWSFDAPLDRLALGERLPRWTRATGSVASAIACRCATTPPTALLATPPTARCRSTEALVTRARSPSSTSTAIIAARITEGSEEMQIRNLAGYRFGFIRP
jgi:hypothetical protein